MMDALLVNPVARALGLTLLHFLWQGVAIAAVVAFALRRAREAPAAMRYSIGCAGLLAMLVAPIVTVFWLLSGSQPMTASGGAGAALSGAVAIDVAARASTLDRLLPTIVLLWAAGVCTLALHLVSGWLDIRRLRRGGRDLGRDWQHRARLLAERLGVTRVVTVLESSQVGVPTVIGWLRPAILLPASVLAGLTPSQLDAILTHELAHVRRHDYVLNVLQSAIETLLFYHPAVWWVSKQVRIEREHCCDDETVRACGDRLEYARALAALEEQRTQPFALGMAATGGPLIGRVRRLLGVRPTDEPRATGWSALTVSLAMVPLLVAAGLAAVEPAPPASPTGNAARTAAPALDATSPGDAAPSATAAVEAAQVSGPVRVGGDVAPPVKIRDVKPFYPEAARESNVQGIVIIEAVISSTGEVEDATVLRGVPMLDDAALEAVRQWRYTPPLLNGDPVSVIMTVTVNFRLNGAQPGITTQPPSGVARAAGVAPASPLPLPDGVGTQVTAFPDDITRVGGEIPAPRKVFDARPVYPEEARAAGVQGIVIAEVLLDVNGNVSDIRVLRSHPLLEQAALDAIWQWRYEPVLVNGVAEPMVMTVTLNFTLE